MDEVTNLRCRNTQLETELRMVKEQLLQAQSGTQYLVNCMSGLQNRYHDSRSISLEAHVHQLQAETISLRERLAFTHGVDGANPSDDGGYPHRFDRTALQQSKLPLGNVFRTESSHFNVPDLLDFECNGTLSESTEWRTWSHDSIKANRNDSLIDSSDDSCPIEPKKQSTVLSFRRPSTNANVPPSPLPGCDLQLRTEEIGEWHALSPLSSPEPELIFNAPFSNAEHNRLSGSASFIEDKSDDQLEECWKSLAGDGRRHSAEEWRRYYEQVVRPAYLAKEAKKQQSSVAVDGIQEEVTGFKIACGAGSHDDSQQGLLASKWAPTLGQTITHERTCGRDELDVVSKSSGTMNSDSVPYPHEDRQQVEASPVEPDEAASSHSQQLCRTQKSLESSLAIEAQDVSMSNPMPEECTDIKIHHPARLNISIPPPLGSPNADKTNSPIRRGRSPSNAHFSPASRPRRRWAPFPTSASHILNNFNSTDENLFHTVLMSNIPRTTTLIEILSIVRGGKIISASFLETAGMKTNPPIDTNAAMIIFLGSRNARLYADFCQQHQITIDSTTNKDMQIQLLRRPTRRLDSQLVFDIRERSYSRVLFIIDEAQVWTPDGVVQKLLCHHLPLKRPLTAGRDEDGVLFFEFADVRDAAIAWKIVDDDHMYFRGASKGFLPDPCARPLATLKQNGPIIDDEQDGPVEKDGEGEGESDGRSTVVDTSATGFRSDDIEVQDMGQLLKEQVLTEHGFKLRE